jgi:pimeloyl-ACP methyl ester carboxylesterase
LIPRSPLRREGLATIHGRFGGARSTIVLLHGHPMRTPRGTWWHPRWSAGFHGCLSRPAGLRQVVEIELETDHATYCDRAMSGDVAAIMGRLGHETFTVVGHDRGQGVAYRTALDHPERVDALDVSTDSPVWCSTNGSTRGSPGSGGTGSPSRARRTPNAFNANPDAWYGLDEAKKTAMGAVALVDAHTEVRRACPPHGGHRPSLRVSQAAAGSAWPTAPSSRVRAAGRLRAPDAGHPGGRCRCGRAAADRVTDSGLRATKPRRDGRQQGHALGSPVDRGSTCPTGDMADHETVPG